MSKKQIAQLESELSALKAKEEAKKGRKYVTCGKCKKKSQIRKLTYIQTHWYTRPHGCTGGDYWNQGEGQFICPKCGIRNRLLVKYSEYARKITALKYHFGEIVETHGDDAPRGDFVNL